MASLSRKARLQQCYWELVEDLVLLLAEHRDPSVVVMMDLD